MSKNRTKCTKKWTLNMKCFEIEEVDEMINKRFAMNLKHEMFWNIAKFNGSPSPPTMNLKHEMFWNL